MLERAACTTGLRRHAEGCIDVLPGVPVEGQHIASNSGGAGGVGRSEEGRAEGHGCVEHVGVRDCGGYTGCHGRDADAGEGSACGVGGARDDEE